MSNFRIPLQALCLLSSNASLKDIKAEMLLFVIRFFLNEYITQNELNSMRLIESNNEDESKTEKKIHDLITSVLAYLNMHVISTEKFNKVFNPLITTKESLYLSKQNEPIGFYYNELAKIIENTLKNVTAYIPEVLALEMLRIFLNEEGKKIPKHKFLEDLDLTEIFIYYEKKNIELKRQLKPNVKLWQVDTPISDAFELANKIMARYSKTHYKININRVSKNRKKSNQKKEKR